MPSKQAVEGSNPSAFTLKTRYISGFSCFYTFRVYYFPTFTATKNNFLQHFCIFFAYENRYKVIR